MSTADERHQPPNGTRDFAGSVRLDDGRSIYVDCRGKGNPPVVLLSAYHTRADEWIDDSMQPDSPRRMVLPAIAETTRVYAYDRPGTATVHGDTYEPSRSDPVPMPRTAQDAVTELHALLTAMGEAGPYVIAAHSLAGVFARLYASTYPDEVAGLVLIDCFSEFVKPHMPPNQWEAYAKWVSIPTPPLNTYRDLEIFEFIPASEALREAAAAAPLRQLPMIVLSKGEPFGLPDDLPGFSADTLENAWTLAQADLAALPPDTPHITVADSSHFIPFQRPDVVIEAIERVVDAVRAGKPAVDPT